MIPEWFQTFVVVALLIIVGELWTISRYLAKFHNMVYDHFNPVRRIT